MRSSLSKKFQKTIHDFLKKFGPQGWWPRLVFHEKSISVQHHADDQSLHLIQDKSSRVFEVCLGAILTQNTNWKNVETSLICLAQKQLITPERLAKARLSSIQSCIRSSGYFRQKAKKLKIISKYIFTIGGDVTYLCHDTSRNHLLSLWGIGPETADTILLYGFKHPYFVIDTYTRRLLTHLSHDASWLKRPYEEVRAFCESSLFIKNEKDRTKHLQEAHAVIVKWGKESKQ